MTRIAKHLIAAAIALAAGPWIAIADDNTNAQEQAKAISDAQAKSEDTAKDIDTGKPKEQAIGLVLSGGGAKGIAHIGVIQALEDNDIPIDFITGTSMGSIVGGMYAAGYTPKEMLDVILSKGFSYWSTGQNDPSLLYYFAADEASPALFSLPITTKRDSIRNAKAAVPASLISPIPMNFAFMDLFAGQTAQCGGDFNRLFVPFRCVASDVDAKHKVVLKEGDLGYSIRSSMSFPIVFQPTTIDSMLLYDGGIYDNFPADVMKTTYAPDFTIGVDVSTKDYGPQTSIIDQVENLVIQNNDYYLDPANGIKISFDLNEFGLLDFAKAKRIYDIGYSVTMNMMDSIKSRIHTRIPKEERELRRAVFKSQTPYIRFDKVAVEGATPDQNQYLEYLFANTKSDTISIDDARKSYYRAISTGKLRDFVPHAEYNDTTGLFSLNLKASVKNNLKFSAGGFITTSTASHLYASLGFSTLGRRAHKASVSAWLGLSYYGAMLNGRMFLQTHIPSSIELQAVAHRQKMYDRDYFFFQTSTPSYTLNSEYYARLKFALALGSLAKMEVGAGFGHIQESFYLPDTEEGTLNDRNSCHFNLGQAFVKFESSTLDNINYPLSGHHYMANAMAVMGAYNYYSATDKYTQLGARPKWLQLELRSRNYFDISSHFAFGVEADLMLSTRGLLDDYTATMVSAPAFVPTPSLANIINPAFRSNSFIAAGIAPIYKYNAQLSARLQGYAFMPIRKIKAHQDSGIAYWGNWFNKPEFFAEFDICYTFPFATLTGYANYATSANRKWNFGLSFGVYLPAPSYLR